MAQNGEQDETKTDEKAVYHITHNHYNINIGSTTNVNESYVRRISVDKELPEEVRKLLLNVFNGKVKDDEECASPEQKEADVCAAKESLERLSVKPDKEIEKLVKCGFESLLQHSNNECPTLDFVTNLKREEAEISSDILEEFNGLEYLIPKISREKYFEVVKKACERHLQDNVPVLKVLADFCFTCSERLQKSDESTRLVSYVKDTHTIFALGKKLAEKGHLLVGAAVIQFAARLFEFQKNGLQSINGIYRCECELRKITKRMGERDVCTSTIKAQVIPTMSRMAISARRIDVPEKSKEEKAEYIAWCHFHIGWAYKYCNDNVSYSEEMKEAASILKQNAGERAADYRLLGLSLHNAGVAYERRGYIEKAKKHLIEALEAIKKCKDWTLDKKNEQIQKTKEQLARLTPQQTDLANLRQSRLPTCS